LKVVEERSILQESKILTVSDAMTNESLGEFKVTGSQHKLTILQNPLDYLTEEICKQINAHSDSQKREP